LVGGFAYANVPGGASLRGNLEKILAAAALIKVNMAAPRLMQWWGMAAGSGLLKAPERL